MVALVSERFISAVRSERRRLERKRGKLEGELKSVDARIAELGRDASLVEARDGLRGRRIREVAIEVLRADRGTVPIHYRDWLRLVEKAGHQVAGKRPDAVFFNQITRSPEVRATTSRGVYQLIDE